MDDIYIKKFINNFTEVEDVEKLKNSDFIYILEKNNNGSKTITVIVGENYFLNLRKI